MSRVRAPDRAFFLCLFCINKYHIIIAYLSGFLNSKMCDIMWDIIKEYDRSIRRFDMKNRILTASVMTMALMLTGCTGAGKAADVPVIGQETEDQAIEIAEPEDDGNNMTIGNPWRDITEEEARSNSVRLFKVPEGATNVCWRIMDSAADESSNKGPLIELDFDIPDEYGTLSFSARYQYGADENEDISGMYYNWTVTDDITLANWGEGNMKGKAYRSINDDETADLCTWYDIEIGISYSLSTVAEDLDGFDIQAVAEAMYNPDNEPKTE